MEERLELDDHPNLLGFLGLQNGNLKLVESRLGVQVFQRGHEMTVSGKEEGPVKKALMILKTLMEKTRNQLFLSPEEVHMLLNQSMLEEGLSDTLPSSIKVSSAGKFVHLKTTQQQRYIQTIQTYDITFGIGPAGTGKTYLAVAAALNALMEGKVKKVILTRPVVEAGENLGFLPGNLEEKIDPYLKPLMDSIYEMLSIEETIRYKERGQIEIAPLAYMRGRTLNHAFIILDEAQNTTRSQMKMFLTRLGHHSKVVVTGDMTQKDLPGHQDSGLETTLKILSGVPGIRFVHFDRKDVVRHPLVIKIIEAFERHEAEK